MVKKVATSLLLSIVMAGSLFAQTVEEKLSQTLQKSGSNLTIEIINSQDAELPGFKYVDMKIQPIGKRVFALTDGNLLIPALIDLNTNTNLVDSKKAEMVKIDIDTDDAHFYFGNKDATTKIIIFSDFECPYCQKASDFLKPLLEREKDNIAIYYYHFPLGFHQMARPLAKMYEAAKELGIEGIDFYHLGAKSEEEAFKKLEIMIPADKFMDFKRLATSNKYDSKIDADFLKGQDIGVQGTPYIIIDGSVVNGFNPSQLENLIMDSIKKHKGKPVVNEKQ